MSRRFHAGFLFAIVTSVVLLQCAHSAEPGRRSKSATRTITQPKFDPAARKVELFAGMEVGAFATRVIALGPQRGSVLITNTTDEPLTVQLPDAFVAVHVLKQFPQGGNAPGGGNNLFGGQQQQQGGQQSVGGGFQQQNGAGNGQNLFGNGMAMAMAMATATEMATEMAIPAAVAQGSFPFLRRQQSECSTFLPA